MNTIIRKTAGCFALINRIGALTNALFAVRAQKINYAALITLATTLFCAPLVQAADYSYSVSQGFEFSSGNMAPTLALTPSLHRLPSWPARQIA